MDCHIVAEYLGISYLIYRHAHHFSADFKIQNPFVSHKLFRRAVKYGKQLFFLHGLYQIVKRRDLVALRNIIGISRYKNDLHGVVFFSQLLCHCNAVHGTHFNVQKQNIVVALLRIVKQKALGRRKCISMHGVSVVSRPAFHHIGYIPSVCVGIVADRYFVFHALSPCRVSWTHTEYHTDVHLFQYILKHKIVKISIRYANFSQKNHFRRPKIRAK